jgi:hypothetical protein
MINYPVDRAISEQTQIHGLSEPVVVRDLVRVVEVLNLKQQGFFNKDSVLAGSMALRCFGSPRFTVYDADFSTSSETVDPRTEIEEMLRYRDDELEIVPAALVPHDERGTAWKSAPIAYVPVFTGLVPNDGDRNFKADISFRGLVLEGVEVPLTVPYDLDIWKDEPIVFVMDPHEILAEKVLGWCVHRQVKHYADLGFIALVSQPKAAHRLIELDYATARETLAAKLEAMRTIQPEIYASFQSVDGLIGDLAKPPRFDAKEWVKLMYLRAHRDRFKQDLVARAVREILVPGLRRAAPR